MSDGPRSKSKSEAPLILGVHDLTSLGPSQRIALVGPDEFSKRREFLKKVFGLCVAGAAAPLLNCGGGKGGGGEQSTCACQNDSVDTCSGNSSCACQADTAPSVPPKLTQAEPDNDTYDGTGSHYPDVYLLFGFDKPMDRASVEAGITISPTVPSMAFSWSDNDTYLIVGSSMNGNSLNRLQLADYTTYTVTIAGTCKDKTLQPLDGNGDGVGGDAHTFTFRTASNSPCSCQGNSCSCQGNTCSCVSYVCSCQLYRV